MYTQSCCTRDENVHGKLNHCIACNKHGSLNLHVVYQDKDETIYIRLCDDHEILVHIDGLCKLASRYPNVFVHLVRIRPVEVFQILPKSLLTELTLHHLEGPEARVAHSLLSGADKVAH